MAQHATQSRAWVDTLAAYLTLLVAFFRLSWRVSTGQHALRVRPGREPFGADLQWPDELALLDVERAVEITQEIPRIAADRYQEDPE